MLYNMILTSEVCSSVSCNYINEEKTRLNVISVYYRLRYLISGGRGFDNVYNWCECDKGGLWFVNIGEIWISEGELTFLTPI